MEYPEGFQPRVHSRKPICGVLGVALAAGVSYDVAHATCKRAMLDLRLGVRFGGRTWRIQREEAMKRLAVRFTRMDEVGVGKTLLDWVKTHGAPDAVYMIDLSRTNGKKAKSGHIVTVRGSWTIDQFESYPIGLHRSRKMFVRTVTRIDGKGW